MKPQELRVGNYVDLYGSIARIERADFDENQEIGIAVDKGKPIPLTEQWLKDFGFEDKEYYWIKWAGKKHIRVNWCSRIVSSGIRNGLYLPKYKHIKYVHQLQNLYFALTGKELTK